jgi:hypothetical protein
MCAVDGGRTLLFVDRLIPPAGATAEQVEEFVSSLRKDTRKRVRDMLSSGAPEDEIAEYIAAVESQADRSPDSIPPDPPA